MLALALLMLAIVSMGMACRIIFVGIRKRAEIDNLIEGLSYGIGFLILSVFFLYVGLKIPYKAETNYTDAVTVAEADGKYYVEKDGKEISISFCEKVRKKNNGRYELKTIKYYTIAGAEAGESHILIIPIKTTILQEENGKLNLEENK